MTDCPACVVLDTLAADDQAGRCPACGRMWGAYLRLVDPFDPEPGSHRNAEREMAALARHPDVRAMDPNRAPRGEDGYDEGVERWRDADRMLARAARHRLAEMRCRLRASVAPDGAASWARDPDGDRYATVVWFAYGERGEVVNARESCAVLIADRYARPGERAAYRAHLESQKTGMTKKQLDAWNPIAFGNALLGAAVAAYQTDQWAPPVPRPPPSARERWAQRIAERWASTRREMDATLAIVTGGRKTTRS